MIMRLRQYIHPRTGTAFIRRPDGSVTIATSHNEIGHSDPFPPVPNEVTLSAEEWAAAVATMNLVGK